MGDDRWVVNAEGWGQGLPLLFIPSKVPSTALAYQLGPRKDSGLTYLLMAAFPGLSSGPQTSSSSWTSVRSIGAASSARGEPPTMEGATCGL